MDTLAIAPSGSRVVKAMAPALVLLLILVGVSAVVRRPGSTTLWLLVALITLVLLFPAYLWLFSRNAKFFVGHQYFGYTDFLGRRQVFALTDLQRVIDRPVLIGGMAPLLCVYLIGPGTRVLYRLNRRVWKSKLEEYMELLGKPVEKTSDPIKETDLMQEVKNTTPG